MIDDISRRSVLQGAVALRALGTAHRWLRRTLSQPQPQRNQINP